MSTHSELFRSTPFFSRWSLAVASVAVALSVSPTEASAQAVNAGAGQTIDIPSITYPNPIDGVRANGEEAKVIGVNAEIATTSLATLVNAVSGGTIELTGGSIDNHRASTPSTIKLYGATADGGTLSLTDVEISLSASGAGNNFNVVTGILGKGTASVNASGVTINVTGDTKGSDAASGVRNDSASTTFQLQDSSTINAAGTHTYGIFATNGSTISSDGTVITTTGYAGHGVYANASNVGGSTVILDGGSITTSGDAGNGLYGARQSNTSEDSYATITATDLDIETSGTGAHAVFADRGSDISMTGGSAKTTANYTAAVRVQSFTQDDKTSTTAAAEVSLTDTEVVATGHAATGVTAGAGGSAIIEGGSVTTEGYEGFALHADGTNTPDGMTTSISAENVVINTAKRAAHGAYAVNGGEIALVGGSIEVQAGGVEGDYPGGWTSGLYAHGAGSEITSTDVAITTHEQWSYGVWAFHEGKVTLDGGSIQTDGVNAHGLSSTGYGSVIISSADVITTGNKAHGAQAYSNGTDEEPDVNTVTLTGGTVNTWGDQSNGIQAARAGSVVSSAANVNTYGADSSGAAANRNGVVNITGGSIRTHGEGSAGLLISDGGEINVANATVVSSGVAARVDFGGEVEDRLATLTLGAGSDVSSLNGNLLTVNRLDDVAGASGEVRFTVGNGAQARGNIADNDPITGEKTGYLDITIDAGGQLTSDSLTGYRNLEVNGSLYGADVLTIGTGSSVLGSGLVQRDVTVDGGSLASSVVIRGNLTLDEANREDVGDVGGEGLVVGDGTQAVIGTVTNGTVDSTGGAAEIGEMGEGSTLQSGNWGASVGSLNGGTIEANNGNVNVTNIQSGGVTSGTVVVNNTGGQTGSGGAFSVGENAALGGNGQVAAHTTVSGSLNPGNSPGALEFLEGLTLTEESNTTMEIAGLGAGQYDTITVAGGDLIFDGTLTLSITSFMSGDTTLNLFSLSGEGEISGEFDLVQLTGVYGNDYFTQPILESTIWSLTLNGNSFAFDSSTGQLTLDVVPEPGSIALFISVAGLGYLLRRRKMAA